MKIPFHLLILKAFNAQKNKVRPYMASLKLTTGQPKILSFLTLHDGCMQRELAAYCDIEPATVSRLLNYMEQSGLIERHVDEKNRRVVRIFLTEKGRKTYRQMEFYFQKVNQRSLMGFSEEEKEQFMDYLLRMHQNLASGTREKQGEV